MATRPLDGVRPDAIGAFAEKRVCEELSGPNTGGEGEVLPQLNVPLPKGCSPDGRGCGPLDAPGLDVARPDMEARKAS